MKIFSKSSDAIKITKILILFFWLVYAAVEQNTLVEQAKEGGKIYPSGLCHCPGQSSTGKEKSWKQKSLTSGTGDTQNQPPGLLCSSFCCKAHPQAERTVLPPGSRLQSVFLSRVMLICGFQEKLLEKRVAFWIQAKLANFGWSSFFWIPIAVTFLVFLLKNMDTQE